MDIDNTLDTSYKGLTNTMAYLEGVKRDVDSFRKTTLLFTEHHQKAREKPKLLRNKAWGKSAFSLMRSMDEIIRALSTLEFMVIGYKPRRVMFPSLDSTPKCNRLLEEYLKR